MKRLFLLSCVALAGTSLFSEAVLAQSSNPCGSSSVGTTTFSPTTMGVQTYQRFSYEPSPTVPLQSSVGARQSEPLFPRVLPMAQSYQRFSYQPSGRSWTNNTGSKKNLWEYSKTDPRKYRP
jgi:hypothetical protein